MTLLNVSSSLGRALGVSVTTIGGSLPRAVCRGYSSFTERSVTQMPKESPAAVIINAAACDLGSRATDLLRSEEGSALEARKVRHVESLLHRHVQKLSSDPNILYKVAFESFDSNSTAWVEDIKAAYKASLPYDLSVIHCSFFKRIIKLLDARCREDALDGKDFLIPSIEIVLILNERREDAKVTPMMRMLPKG